MKAYRVYVEAARLRNVILKMATFKLKELSFLHLHGMIFIGIHRQMNEAVVSWM